MARALVLPAALGVLVFVCLLGAGTVRAQSDLTIESPRLEYDQEAGIYRYRDARLTLGELTLTAGLLEYDANTGQVTGSGNVRVQQGTVLAEAQHLTLDVETRLLVLEDANLHETEDGFYLKAESVRLPEYGHFEAEDCILTTCPPREPAWSISASHLDYQQDSFAVARNPVLSLGPVPVFWIPFVSWPTVDNRQSGFLRPSYSEQRSSLARLDVGTRLTVPYFLALDVDHDLTISPEVISERGVATDLEYNYAFWEDQEGQIRLFTIRESFARNPGEENDILPEGEAGTRDPFPTRQMLDWSHNQGFGNTRLIFQGAHSSDGQVRREYDRDQYYSPYRTLQSTVSSNGWWGAGSIYAEQTSQFTSESLYADEEAYTDLSERAQLQPSLRYSQSGQFSQELPLGWLFNTQVANFQSPDAETGRLGLVEPGLTLPITLGGAFQLRTQVRQRLVQYDDLTGALSDSVDAPSDGFQQTVAGVELSTVLAREYDGSLKHRLIPRLLLDWVEDVEQPMRDVVQPTFFAKQLITFRLDNELVRPISRGEEQTARRIVGLDIIQRYNVLREADAPDLVGPAIPDPQETETGEPLLPLIVDSDINGSGYRFDLNLHYHHQLGRVTENAVGLSGAASSRARLAVTYRQNEFDYYTPDGEFEDATNSLGLGGRFLVSDLVGVTFTARVNLTNQTPPLNRRLDRVSVLTEYSPNCYSVGLQYTERVDSTVENDATRYYYDRRIDLVFDLGGYFSSSSSAIFGDTTL